MIRLLIVDDNVATCRVLARLLGRDGFEVSFVHDGEQALDRVATDKPGLMLLDWMMPHMSGGEVLRSLDQQGTLDELAVVVYSAIDEPTRMGDALRLGASDYIVKGTPYPDVLSRLMRASGQSDA